MVNMDYRYSLRRIQKFVGHMTSVNLKINLQRKTTKQPFNSSAPGNNVALQQGIITNIV
jgi:hypothetical protein